MIAARASLLSALFVLLAFCPEPSTPRGDVTETEEGGVVHTVEILDEADRTVIVNRWSEKGDGEYRSNGVITLGDPSTPGGVFLDWGIDIEIPFEPGLVLDLTAGVLGTPAQVCTDGRVVRVYASRDLEGGEFRSAVFSFAAWARAPGDINGDGRVDGRDLPLLLAAWGSDDGGPADLDGDGLVGPLDLEILLGAWTG
jgi:hypothetical protein